MQNPSMLSHTTGLQTNNLLSGCNPSSFLADVGLLGTFLPSGWHAKMVHVQASRWLRDKLPQTKCHVCVLTMCIYYDYTQFCNMLQLKLAHWFKTGNRWSPKSSRQFKPLLKKYTVLGRRSKSFWFSFNFVYQDSSTRLLLFPFSIRSVEDFNKWPGTQLLKPSFSSLKVAVLTIRILLWLMTRTKTNASAAAVTMPLYMW